MACESGEFRLINHCFNNISPEQFTELNELKSNDNTPGQLALEGKFDQKLEIFKILNLPDKDKNTVIHKLVNSNQIKKLRDLLDYLSSNCLIDTVGFGLKNSEGKTAIDIAIQKKNAEAIYLLNHFELNEKKLNTRTYTREVVMTSIKKFLPEESTTTNAYGEVKKVQIRNLIFQGGGIKGLAYLGCLKELEEKAEMGNWT